MLCRRTEKRVEFSECSSNQLVACLCLFCFKYLFIAGLTHEKYQFKCELMHAFTPANTCLHC